MAGKHRLPTATNNGLKVVLTAGSVLALSTVVAQPASAATVDWDAIIKCESGGNPTAKNVSSTASGLFQFINGTWAAYGGTDYAPTAREATIAEQYIVANRAYAAEGFQPWSSSKSCWSGLLGSTTPVKTAETVAKAPKRVEAAPIKQIPASTPRGRFTPSTGGNYEVVSGDTLTAIARTHDTTIAEILADNPAVIEDPDWIYVGERLIVG